MIAEAGLAALWLAAALALVQLVSGARPVAVAQAVMAAVAVFAMVGDAPAIPLILAAALLALALFAMHRRSRWSRRAPTANVGITLASAGAAMLMLGVACDWAFPQRTVAIAKPGDRLHVGPWLVEFATIDPVVGPDFTAIEAELRATRGRGVTLLRPQWRTMIAPQAGVSQTAAATFWDGRLTATLDASNDTRQFHLQWRPFLPLVWLGAALVAVALHRFQLFPQLREPVADLAAIEVERAFAGTRPLLPTATG